MSTEEQIIDSKGIQSISEFYEKNKKNVSIAGIALIVLAAGIWYYKSIYTPALKKKLTIASLWLKDTMLWIHLTLH